MKAPDIREAEQAVARIEAGEYNRDDVYTVVRAWQRAREMCLRLERCVHDCAKELEAVVK